MAANPAVALEFNRLYQGAAEVGFFKDVRKLSKMGKEASASMPDPASMMTVVRRRRWPA